MAKRTFGAWLMTAVLDSDRECPVVNADRLGRRFQKSNWAVRNVNLAVDKGEIFGILGPDGAGKTTLIQMLSAILDPSEGSCTVLGYDTVREDGAVTSRIGYMSQGFTLYDRLTVQENLQFSARIRAVAQSDRTIRQQRLLEMAGLANVLDRRADQLSGGMRKKLSLCANLIHHPPLLLLDELSLGVDPVSRRELWGMLREFRDEGATIVISTPYMDEAEDCDRIAFMNRGTILTAGRPREVAAVANGRVFELATDQILAAERIAAQLPSTLSVQVLPDRVRFQLGDSQPLSSADRQALTALGDLAEPQASLEDAFLWLSRSTIETAELQVPELRSKDSTSGSDAIQIESVTCQFREFKAVDDVSMSIRRGEIFGFLGPNGAGKTTLIRAMCGLIRPSSGSIHVAGVDAIRAPKKLAQKIGYMSQRFSLYLDLTPGENLEFFAGIYGIRAETKRNAIRWAKEATGIARITDRKVVQLSGALRQRLALACSIVHRPLVLFLDEPTSGVDPLSRYRFWQLIRSLAEAGITVFVTTHYLEEAAYCDRLGFILRGRLIASGDHRKLQEELGMDQSVSVEDIFMAYIDRESDKRHRLRVDSST